jgi:hypothetical protein
MLSNILGIVWKILGSLNDNQKMGEIHLSCCDLLSNTLEAFYPSQHQQAEILLQLISNKHTIQNINLRKHLTANILEQMKSSMNYEYALDSATRKPSGFITTLLREASQELAKNLALLLLNCNGNLDASNISPIVSFLMSYQKELFSHSMSEEVLGLVFHYASTAINYTVELLQRASFINLIALY